MEGEAAAALDRVGRELRRKAIHVASAAVPLSVWIAPRGFSLALVLGAAALALLIDFARLFARPARFLFLRRTRTLLRLDERSRLTGATYLALAFVVAFLLFPVPVAVVAMLYASLGDAAAAVVGRTWGRHRIVNGKSLEGAAAAFAVNAGVGLLVPAIGVAAALAGAAAATVVEIADPPPDDNLWVVIGGGSVLWLTFSL
jgi:dolichol kinase